MLSRRNIRIKVMQAVYAYSQDREMSLDDAQRMYKRRVEESFELYLFALHYIIFICSYAKEDKLKRAEKYLPTPEDKAFNDILYTNEMIKSIYKNQYFQLHVDRNKFKDQYDKDLAKQLYKGFAKTEEYISYSTSSKHTDEDHIEILHDLLRYVKGHETFNEVMEDAYANWVDDKSLVVGTLKKTFKSLPIEGKYFEKHYPPTDTVKEFGEQLFVKVQSREKELEEIIEPTLENWDMERLAMVDTICLKMAIAELLYFPTIPVKVTINEYVELVKNYSTDKSKEFINGILDKVMNQLKDEGKINKQGRGLLD